MGFLEKVLTKKPEDETIEEFLNTLDVEEESVYEDADAYVKPVSLNDEKDVASAIDEMKKGNILLLNIAELAKRNQYRLRELIAQVRDEASRIDGDIARISVDRVLVTPSKVKIIKKKGE